MPAAVEAESTGRNGYETLSQNSRRIQKSWAETGAPVFPSTSYLPEGTAGSLVRRTGAACFLLFTDRPSVNTMSTPLRRIITGLGICLTASVAATESYVSAGWSVLDATYMVVITLFGIGYGEVRPIVDPALKLQTMALIIVGGLSGLYSVGGFIQLITAGEVKRAMGNNLFSGRIKKMKNHTIVCGYGRVGKLLAHKALYAGFTSHRDRQLCEPLR